MSRQESQISALFGGAKGTVMEVRSGRLVAFVGAVMLLAGCATTRNASGDEAGSRSDVRFERGGFVLDGRALEDGPGTIVGTLSGKIPNFRLQRTPGLTNECPRITLRSSVTFSGFANPHVYVDGIRTTDTCVLTQLKTHDVERVEVYSQGFTWRPGYGTHAHGLILVFMRSAGA